MLFQLVRGQALSLGSQKPRGVAPLRPSHSYCATNQRRRKPPVDHRARLRENERRAGHPDGMQEKQAATGGTFLENR